MTITTNETFKQLLASYNLAPDYSFQVEMPAEVQTILSDPILITEYGVTLKSFNRLYKAKKAWENQSIIEDNENHFHVDWCISPADCRKAFMLGIKTLILLADKFQQEKVNGIRFCYSFQTPELGRQHWVKQNNLYEEDDEYFISDRLSFYKRRDGEEIMSIEKLMETKFWAMLVIDI